MKNCRCSPFSVCSGKYKVISHRLYSPCRHKSRIFPASSVFIPKMPPRPTQKTACRSMPFFCTFHLDNVSAFQQSGRTQRSQKCIEPHRNFLCFGGRCQILHSGARRYRSGRTGGTCRTCRTRRTGGSISLYKNRSRIQGQCGSANRNSISISPS